MHRAQTEPGAAAADVRPTGGRRHCGSGVAYAGGTPGAVLLISTPRCCILALYFSWLEQVVRVTAIIIYQMTLTLQVAHDDDGGRAQQEHHRDCTPHVGGRRRPRPVQGAAAEHWGSQKHTPLLHVRTQRHGSRTQFLLIALRRRPRHAGQPGHGDQSGATVRYPGTSSSMSSPDGGTIVCANMLVTPGRTADEARIGAVDVCSDTCM